MSPTTRAPLRLLAAAAAGLAVAVASGPAPAAADPPEEPRPVLLAGLGGLRWDDLSPADTPALWELAGEGAIGSLSVRTVHPVSCPMDGWLTLNAGVRATTVEQGPGDGGACRPVTVVPEGRDGGSVPEMSGLRRLNDDYDNDPHWGLLESEVRRAGQCSTAVGPGAAVALADAEGRVASYLPSTSQVDSSALERCGLTVVDLGTLPPDGPERDRAVHDADDELARLLALAPNDTVPLVAGVSDDSGTPHLHVAVAGGERYDDGWLTAASTRYPGMVQLTDLTPTLLSLIGADTIPNEAVGSVWETTGGRPGELGSAVATRVDDNTKAQVVRDVVQWFLAAVAVSQLAVYAVLLALRRRTAGPRRRTRRDASGAALFFGAVPVATFLANLVPWWGTAHPAVALMILVTAGAAAVAGVALAGPWRDAALGPAGAVAGITAAVLAVDVMSGSRLQMSSLMGHSPLVAGRFYGFGNVAFGVFAAGVLLTAAAAGGALLRAGRRRAAIATAATIGAVGILIDGWPDWGSDFGGVLALVPATAVLALLLAGIRVTLFRAALIGVAAVVTVSAVTLVDWLSPPADRSHLGDFAQALSDGTGWPVIARKAAAAGRTLTGSPLAMLVPLALAGLALVVSRPARMRATVLERAYATTPALRAGLVSVVVAGVVGFATNDSGVIVPAVMLTVAVPLGLAAALAAGPPDARPGPAGDGGLPPRVEPAGATDES